MAEYSGELLRPSLCDVRERAYASSGAGVYFFALSRDAVIDATRLGSVARFINHSCDPNCAARRLFVEGRHRVAVLALRDLEPGAPAHRTLLPPPASAAIRVPPPAAAATSVLSHPPPAPKPAVPKPPPGVELTFDYQLSSPLLDPSGAAAAVAAEGGALAASLRMMACACGAPSCRRYL